MMRTAIACGLLMAVAACGSDGTGNTDVDGGSGGSDAGSGSGSGGEFVPPEGFKKLIGRTWSIPPGSADTYRCVRVTLTEDTFLTNIIAQAPLGTHHTVLSIASGNVAGPDGEQNCGVGSLGMVMLYASGVGTSPLDFPPDVSVKIPAGTQIHLNLHLFNASDEPLSGESGIWVKSQSTPTPTLAEMVFAGTFLFSIPPSGMESKADGGCTVGSTANDAFTLFALWPHMHVLATKSKFEILRGAAEPMVLHDKPYSFEEQTYWKMDPEIQVQPGDKIRVTCTWVNPVGNGAVIFGDSTNQEMCFTGMYRYPAKNAGLFQCTDNPGGLGL